MVKVSLIDPVLRFHHEHGAAPAPCAVPYRTETWQSAVVRVAAQQLKHAYHSHASAPRLQ